VDLLQRLIDKITTNIALPAPIQVGVLSTQSPAICIRQTPSYPSTKYLDKGNTYHFAFQILIKDHNQQQAVFTLQDITFFLDTLENGAIVSGNGSFSFVSCNVYTMPNFVQKTEHDEYVYTALFQAEIERRGV
jgi:hypothetical protein